MLAPNVFVPFLLFFVVPALLFGVIGWKAWLKHQREIGATDAATAREMADVLESMQEALDEARATRAALTRRVQNLEAIVTSEAWDEARDARTLADDLAAGRPTSSNAAPADAAPADPDRSPGDGAARLDLDARLGPASAADAEGDEDAGDLARRTERLARRLRRR